jgi:hypothetical protein
MAEVVLSSEVWAEPRVTVARGSIGGIQLDLLSADRATFLIPPGETRDMGILLTVGFATSGDVLQAPPIRVELRA